MSDTGASDAGAPLAPGLSGGNQSIGQRSATESEALVLARAAGLVSECRAELRELRARAKAARSNRERCMAALAAGSEAVGALEEVCSDAGALDARGERALCALAGRVQGLMDQAEALVDVYGRQGGLGKFASRMFNPGVGAKFEAITAELQAHAKQVRLLAEGDAYSRGRGSSGTASGSLSARGAARGGPQASRAGSEASAMGISRLGRASGSLPSQHSVAEAGRASGAWPPVPRHGRSASTGSQLGAAREAARDSAPSTPPDGALAAADSGLSRSTWADREPPTRTSTVPSSPGLGGSMAAPAVGAATAIPVPERLHRGKAGQSVTALLLIPPGEDEPRGSLGHAWYYVTRTLGGGTLHVVHLSSQVHSEVRAEGVVTALHLDAAGLVWAGHRNGTVRAWEHSSRAPVCDPLRAFHSSVTALTCDERGACWAASSRGNVRCLRLGEVLRGGAPVGCRLSLVGSLRWSGSAAPADAAALEGVPEDGMVNSELLREQAHYGPVSALAAAVGRVWTAGGSSAFVCLREWSQRGELLASNDLRSMGTVNAMAITSPLVRVLLPAERGAHPAATASVISLAPRSGGTGPGGAALATELQQVWQLLTVHDSGMVQVWTMVAGLLRPILRIGERTSPAKGLAVCESLGAVCTSHLDGRLLVRPLPHPKSPGGLTINYVAGSVGQARMPYGEIQASKTGLAHVQGAGAGVVTSSMNGTISLWGDAALRAAASQRGLALMGELSPREAWPLFCYNSAVLAYAMAEASAGLGLAAGPGDASDDDLLRGAGRVIGEGAFGKVYLGRWQETDVAIKVLTSLQAFGIGAAGATVAGPDGEVRLDPEVLRTLEREVGIMVAIRHPNIILFMGVCLDPACIVTEFCARGSLYDLLKVAAANPDASARVLDWGKRLNMALDAAKGMLHLHSHRGPIIHRDLKSPNLLVDKHWRVKVTDFNLSRLSDTVSVASSMVANNPRWHAPESYSKASDVYAYGLILWELLTWQLPFAAQTPFQIILMVAERGERPPIPDSPAEYQGGDFEGSADYLALMQDPFDAPSTLGTNGGSLHRPSPFDVGVPNPSSSFKVLRPYDLAGSSGRVPGVTSASPASNAGMIAQTFSLRSSQLSSESSATAPNLSQVASGPHTASDDSAEPRTVA
ncbi:putative serine/threonine-protein kinase drkA [Auxenochlorella protothecoides]|uniref:Putative serine/threonine-protein kinase drkA n=1 Tax=Auxenochlorella protothecoides TaxID=3075 RepID=A0A087SHH5_AUXPR|nr:putative serine/threonine-protein kinase drkA [Auxenochlorella protothecoides]KFM25179.1 putative serine/threonine-protein kinase drkA [Auxenochlorella protothecoides]